MTDHDAARPGDDSVNDDAVRDLDDSDKDLANSELEDAGLPDLPEGPSSDSGAPLP